RPSSSSRRVGGTVAEEAVKPRPSALALGEEARFFEGFGAILRGEQRLDLHHLLGGERSDLIASLKRLKIALRALARADEAVQFVDVFAKVRHYLRLDLQRVLVAGAGLFPGLARVIDDR